MKYSRTALGLLNAQYRSVLRKCMLINLGLFAITAIAVTPANAEVTVLTGVGTTTVENVATSTDGSTVSGKTSIVGVNTSGNTTATVYTKAEADAAFDAAGAAAGVRTEITSGTITALKATQDGNGNVITSTYVTKSDITDGTVTALKATQDGNGNVISSTYATKSDITNGIITALKATQDGNGNVISSTYATQNTTINGHALSSNVTLTASDVNADAAGTAAGLVNALDAIETQIAGTDGLSLKITQIDGKITAVEGAITANTYDSYGSAAAVENKLDDGAAGYDIDAKTLKVQGADVLTASSALNGANITAGTITLEKIASSAIQGAADPVTYTGTKLTTQGYVDETKASILAGTGYSGSGLETAVTSTVTANAADGTYSSSGTYAANTIGKAIQTAQTDITALQTATTFTADGNYYAQTDTVANAIKKVDTQVKTNTGNIATNTSDIATINTKLGAVENLFSNGSSPIGRGDSVAAILSSVDTELDAATTKNTAQDTKLSGLATAIGGTYDSTTNVFTKNTYGTTLYTVNDSQSLTTAIGALDNALGSVATAKSAVAGASAATNLSDVVAQLSDNLTNGTVNAEFANTTVDSLTIDGTNYGITATGDANMHSLDIGTTGKGFDASGNAKTGTLTIGTANAITGTSTSLDINGNDLTNVKDLTTTGNATIGGGLSVTGASSLHNTSVNGTMTLTDGTVANTFTMNAKSFTVDSAPAKGVELSGSMFANGGVFASTNGFSVVSPVSGTPDTYTTVFDIDDKGNITSDMLKTDGTTNNTVTLGKDTNTKNILNGSLQFGTATGTPTVNAIDDGATAATSAGTNNATTMATLASVLTSAENADYTVGSSAKNITEATSSSGKTTLHTAIDTLDNEIGADTDYGTGTGLNNGVVGTATVKANIAAINDKLGNIPDTAVNGYAMTASGATLVGAVNKLDTNMEGVLGGIYNQTTGAYDNTALLNDTTPNGFETGASNLSDALTKYAENNQAAMGTTYVAGGSFANKYADKHSGTVTYYGLANTDDLVSAISQLEENIGAGTALDTITDRTTAVAKNGVASTKTVNANIVALNETVGDLTGLNTTLGNLTNGGATNPATVVKALNNIDATLGKIHGLVASADATTTTTGVAYYGNLAVGTTVEEHIEAVDTAIGDRRNLGSANEAINQGTKTSVAAGMRAVGDAIGDMNFTGSHYVSAQNDLSGAVRSLDSNLYRVESDLRDLRRDFRRGMASMSAMSALVPNPRAHGNTSLAIGTGAYDGHTAAAIGGFHYLTDNIMLNAGVAWGNSSDAAYRMGVTFSW